MQGYAVFRRSVYQLRTALIDLLFPPQCVHCGAYGAFFCASCAQQVEPVGPARCECCGRPQPKPVTKCEQCQQQPAILPDIVRIAALHTSPLREAVHALKYEQRPELAETLARYLVALVQQEPQGALLCAVDGVAPVPLYRVRQRERGYNQSELLASAFCRGVQLPLRSDWLTRQRSTQSQVGLSVAERRQNVQNAFVAAPAVKGQRILLIDDVYTTGATMRSCAQAALNAGAQAVYGLALACPR